MKYPHVQEAISLGCSSHLKRYYYLSIYYTITNLYSQIGNLVQLAYEKKQAMCKSNDFFHLKNNKTTIYILFTVQSLWIWGTHLSIYCSSNIKHCIVSRCTFAITMLGYQSSRAGIHNPLLKYKLSVLDFLAFFFFF